VVNLEELVELDPQIHGEEFVQMNIEYITSLQDLLDETYQLDTRSILETSVEERAKMTLDEFTRIKSPNGIVYILEVNGKVAGMGALRKIGDGVGEVKRMFNYPRYRGKGYGRKMLNKLMEAGREFGFSTIKLDTPKFAYAAQGLYHSVGFKEVEVYPESDIQPPWDQYWLYMEKKE